MEIKRIGNIFGYTRGSSPGNVYDKNFLAPTINTMQGGYRQPMIIDEQLSVRIRKLTPKECYRLMGFDDEAFERAEQVNSNTQLYKQAGNSIVVDVLVAIFDNLLVHSRSAWLDELLESEQEFCQRTAKKKTSYES